VRQRGIRRQLEAALKRVGREITQNAAHSHIAGALSGEGYAGGYRDALQDISLLLDGATPQRRNYWEDS